MGKAAKHKAIRRIAKQLPPVGNLNHNRKMKAIYNQYGTAGVREYISAVDRWQKNQEDKTENK